MVIGASSITGSGSSASDRAEVLTISDAVDRVQINTLDGQESSQIGDKRKREGSTDESNAEKDEIETKKDETAKDVEVAIKGDEMTVNNDVDDKSESRKEEKIEDNNESRENGNENGNGRTGVEGQNNKEEEIVKKPLAVTPNVHSVTYNGSSSRQPVLTDR